MTLTGIYGMYITVCLAASHDLSQAFLRIALRISAHSLNSIPRRETSSTPHQRVRGSTMRTQIEMQIVTWHTPMSACTQYIPKSSKEAFKPTVLIGIVHSLHTTQ